MNSLDRINNKIGTFTGASTGVPPGTSRVTYVADMDLVEIHDPTDTLRLGVEADFGAGFRPMLWGPLWTGGTGQTAPSISWQYNADHPPLRVRPVLENITQVIAGVLTPAFS